MTKLATWEHLLLGGMSGAVAAAATCPLDALKTAQQVVVGSAVPPRGALGTLRTTVAASGPGTLFVGMVRTRHGTTCSAPCMHQGARVTQTALMSAVMFSMFEVCKAQLKRDREPEDGLSPKLLSKPRVAVLKRQFARH